MLTCEDKELEIERTKILTLDSGILSQNPSVYILKFIAKCISTCTNSYVAIMEGTDNQDQTIYIYKLYAPMLISHPDNVLYMYEYK